MNKARQLCSGARFWRATLRLGCWLALLMLCLDGSQGYPQVNERLRVQENVIYGMYSGLALLMDVWRPAQPNGYGIILIPGSGWSAPTQMDARPLKDEPGQVEMFAPRLTEAGYTVFVINHRAAPRFHYPIEVEDAQRAVRFVRHTANDLGIQAARIGAVGYSSGGNLAMMLGVLPDQIDPASTDPIEHESARVQCVVAGGAPADLTHPKSSMARQILSDYLGVPIHGGISKTSRAYRLLLQASPSHYATRGDAPMMLFNGDQDRLVPISNIKEMNRLLSRVGVPSKMIGIHGASHWPISVPGAPDIGDETVRWFDKYLKVDLKQSTP
jgi:acetyl esterase/lipase